MGTVEKEENFALAIDKPKSHVNMDKQGGNKLMKHLLIILCLLNPNIYAEANSQTITMRVNTYMVQLLTKDNKHVTDTVSANDENDARRIIRYRYPNCIIYSITKL